MITQNNFKYTGIVALLLLLPTFGCKKGSRASSTSSMLDSTADLIVVNGPTVEAAVDCRNALINLFTNAVSDGLLTNGALTGLGTDYPTGKKLAAESAYFQLVRIFSIADWELPDSITAAQTKGCLPSDVSVGMGTFDRGGVTNLSTVFEEEADALRKAETLLPISIKMPTIVRSDDAETPRAWPQPTTIGTNLRQAQISGTRTKMRYAKSVSAQNDDIQEKLRAMLTALTPLAGSVSASFPPPGSGDAKLYAELYLPPLTEFSADNIDDVRSWKLRQGVGLTPLPKEVDVNVARITHIGYLDPTTPPEEPLIKFQMYKDFKNPDELMVRIVFGQFDASGDDQGRIPLDVKNYRSAFIVSFYPNLAVKSDDGSIRRFLKTQINAVANQFRIDARIHQLTLKLRRDSGKDPVRDGVDAILLKPHFSLRDSDLSFRLHQVADSAKEERTLTRVGFTCQPAPAPPKLNCYRDFGAYAELENYLLEGPTRLSTRIGRKIMKVLNQLVAHNSRFLINLNMEAIEEAIDLQFATLVSDFIETQDKRRVEVRERLEKALFNEKK